MNVQKLINETSELVLCTSLSAGLGYLCARAFTALNPVHAAAAFAVGYLVAKVTYPFFEAFFAPGSNNASKIVGTVLHFTVSVAISSAITTGLSIPFSFSSLLYLNAMAIGFIASIAFIAFAAGLAGLTFKNVLNR